MFVDTVGIEMSLAPITRLRSSVPGLSLYLKGHWFELAKSECFLGLHFFYMALTAAQLQDSTHTFGAAC